MVKMFDEEEYKDLESLNNWYRGYLISSYNDIKKEGWVKRFECFLCKKDETLNKLEKQYESLIKHLKGYEIRKSNDEQIAKFADALPAEWNEFLIHLNLLMSLKRTSMKMKRKKVFDK